jgi:hypothetical protein
MKKIIFSLMIASLYSAAIWAAEDSTFIEIAGSREYPGGADESDLKVQTQLLKLQKSKNETVIEDEEGF